MAGIMDTTRIVKVNLLLYEPADIDPTLQIAFEVLRVLKGKMLAPYRPIMAELLEKGFVDSLDIEVLMRTETKRCHPFVVERLNSVPVASRFYLNAEIYYESGGIPSTLDELKAVYQQLAPEGIHAAFFNTSKSREYLTRLAGMLLTG